MVDPKILALFQKDTYSNLIGAYDNIIASFGPLGKFLRALLQWLERTPLRALGLSRFWVVEKFAD